MKSILVLVFMIAVVIAAPMDLLAKKRVVQKWNEFHAQRKTTNDTTISGANCGPDFTADPTYGSSPSCTKGTFTVDEYEQGVDDRCPCTKKKIKKLKIPNNFF